MADVTFLSLVEGTPAEGYWDQALIIDLLKDLPDSERKVFVIPGAKQADLIAEINETLNLHEKVLVFITSDEEGNFPIDKLKHKDMKVYSQYGYGENLMPLGYTTFTRKLLQEQNNPEKELAWFYAGQINHERRQELAQHLQDLPGGAYLPSKGFAQGLEPRKYYELMAQAVAVPCPPGNLTQDSFRVYETLEAGGVPIIDQLSAQGNRDYWDRVFADRPFPMFNDYTQLPGYIISSQSPRLRNRVFAWWQQQKQLLKRQIKKDLGINDATTIVVPTSPIPSHPSTEIIDQTIQSIRYHTDAEIIITIDGVRPEQEEMRPQYEEYIRNLLWKCNFEYTNVTPVLFESHVHQVGMMRKALEMIETPLVFYVEHDTPLVTDEEIDWEFLTKTILRGDAFAIRFHYEAQIPKEHEYLMLPEKDMPYLSATKQWSQRPHIAATNFYREIMKFFSPDANCFIEDFIYGKCVEGEWDDWKLFIYRPDEKNIKRSLNLDGRAGDTKFEKEQQW